MKFLNETHKERFNEMVEKSNMYKGDLERKALFYILSGHSDLYEKSSGLYDFKKNIIIRNYQVDLSGSLSKLVYLGFNLYNNYTDERNLTPLDIICGGLDDDCLRLALNAMLIRARSNI